MIDTDKILLGLGAVGGVALLYFVRAKQVRPLAVWALFTCYLVPWLNVALWRGGHWSLGGCAVMSALAVFSAGIPAFRGWEVEWSAKRAEEKRRARYRDYPFNQHKPDDIDAPPV